MSDDGISEFNGMSKKQPQAMKSNHKKLIPLVSAFTYVLISHIDVVMPSDFFLERNQKIVVATKNGKKINVFQPFSDLVSMNTYR